MNTLIFCLAMVGCTRLRNITVKWNKSFVEQGDADHRGAAEALPRLQQLTRQHNLNDIWNAEEFGLYYSAAPKSTIGPTAFPGDKKAKGRAKFLVCTDADGTESVSPFLVGRAHQPRCFSRATPEELGIYYDYGPKVWMNSTILRRWLHGFVF